METTTAVTVCLHCIRYDFCIVLYGCGTVRVRVLSMRGGLLTRGYGYYRFVTYGCRFVFVSRRFFYSWVSAALESGSEAVGDFEASALLG